MPRHGIDEWCRRWLGAEPVRDLFQAGYLSQVAGLELADGRKVVVKVRPASERITACVNVHRRLWAAGFPCPELLAGPEPIGDLIATAEALRPDGGQLEPGPDSPRLFAEALAELVRLAPPVETLPTLDPPPAWVWWDHCEPGVWPAPDDRMADLNVLPGPKWLDDVGHRVRARLKRYRRPPIVGHVDWESQNIRWVGRRLHAVHDWDSVATRPEAVIAGVAAAVFTATGALLTEASLDETEEFLTAYEQARGRPWGVDDRQACWAAGLWVRAFNARKESLSPDGEPVLDRLAGEAAERLRRAGA